MPTIDEIYKIVEESSHETAFNAEECTALFNTLMKLPNKARVVEVGIEYGRSTSVIAEVGKLKGFEFTAVDSWCQDNGKEAKAHVLEQIVKHSWNVNIWSMDSLEAATQYQEQIDLIHIDGDHEYKPVLADCHAWLPKLKERGYVCFDDYGHDSLPGVFQAVTEYISESGRWKYIGRFGNKLGIFQKL